MRSLATVLGFCFVVFVPAAGAHEYPLQFTPASGYRSLVVAGYGFIGGTVVGNCSYYTVRSGGSGKGGGYKSITTYYNQTCTWNLYGTLLSIAPGAPVVPAPLYTSGTQTVYATNGSGATTGHDSALPPYGGFVNTPSSHYTWLTPNSYTILQQVVYTMTVTLQSDGDVPLNISAVEVSALQANATLSGTTCIGATPVGNTCSITVTYDPTKLRTPTGLAYDTLDIALVSDAGQPSDFKQSYTITVKKSDD